MTKIYIYDISSHKYNIDKLKSELSYLYIKERDKYQKEKDKILSLISYTVLSKYLKDDFNYINTNLKIDENNKPYLEGIYFNISHSKNMIAIIISDYECGIDIEMIDYNKDYSKNISRILNEEEQIIYVETDNKEEYFTKCWTKKEAYLKKLGTGIILSKLKDIYINIPSLLISDKQNNKYILSICTNNKYTISYI